MKITRFPNILITLLLLCVAACQTTSALLGPDGTVLRDAAGNPILVKEPDLASTQAYLQLALSTIDNAFALWQSAHPAPDPAALAAQQAAHDQQTAFIQSLVTQVAAGLITPAKATTAAKATVTQASAAAK